MAKFIVLGVCLVIIIACVATVVWAAFLQKCPGCGKRGTVAFSRPHEQEKHYVKCPSCKKVFSYSSTRYGWREETNGSQ